MIARHTEQWRESEHNARLGAKAAPRRSNEVLIRNKSGQLLYAFCGVKWNGATWETVQLYTHAANVQHARYEFRLRCPDLRVKEVQDANGIPIGVAPAVGFVSLDDNGDRLLA